MKPKILLVPIDFSPWAEAALDYATMLAEKLGATVYLVNAIGAALPELSATLTETMTKNLVKENLAALAGLADARRAVAAFGPSLVKIGDARDCILEAATELDADMIVMGTHGRRGISRALLGSVAEDVVRRAPCPVLTVRTKRKGKP